jgi:hypothetical protein
MRRRGDPAAGGTKRRLPSSITTTRDPYGWPLGCCLRRRNGCKHDTSASTQPTSGHLGRSSSCGNYRLRPALGGDSRPTRVRDIRGMPGRPAVERRQKMPICRYFYGSDGTRTATSGVTGRASGNDPGRRSTRDPACRHSLRRTSAPRPASLHEAVRGVWGINGARRSPPRQLPLAAADSASVLLGRGTGPQLDALPGVGPVTTE